MAERFDDCQGAPHHDNSTPRTPQRVLGHPSAKQERAITAVDKALQRFEFETGLSPRVVLLPRRVFNQYMAEMEIIESAMPYTPPGVERDAATPDPRHEAEWSDVRLVEHETLETIEVY